MDAAGRGGYAAGMTVVGADLPPSTARAAVWRRPPRSAPEGRHASSGRSLAMLGVLVSLYVYSLAGAMLALAPGIPWAAALPPLVICAVGVGYGLVIIATARLPRMRLVMRDWGLGDSPAAKVWLGLAYILPLAGSFVAGWTLHAAGQLSSPLASSPLISYVGLFGPVAFAICLILARVCSLRAVKQAILPRPSPLLHGLERRGLVVGRGSMDKRGRRHPRERPPLAGHQLLVDGAGVDSATASTHHPVGVSAGSNRRGGACVVFGFWCRERESNPYELTLTAP